MRQMRLLKSLLYYRLLNEKAYLANFVASMTSAVIYTIVYAIFITLLYQRVDTVAGYSKNDLLSLYLLMQAGFFVALHFFYYPLFELIRLINTGLLDQLLARPIPLKTWIIFNGFNPVLFLLDIIPASAIIMVMIDWSAWQSDIMQIIASGLIWLCGMAIIYALLLLFTYPAFKNGESTELLHVFWGMDPGPIPYERQPKGVKIAAFSVLPVLLYSSVSTAVLLGKLHYLSVLPLALLSASLALLMQEWVWKRALRIYTSASS